MILRRALCVGLLACGGLALAELDAGPKPEPPTVRPSTDKGAVESTEPGNRGQAEVPRTPFIIRRGPGPVAGDGRLTARQPLAKTPAAQLNIPEAATGVIVKFTDAVQARSRDNGARVISMANENLSPVDAILARYGVRLVRAINHPENRLAELEARAAAQSGKAQPDLAGMMYIEGALDNATLLEVARALNDLPNVEYVEAQLPTKPSGPRPRNAALPRGNRQNIETLTSGDLVERANAALNVRKSAIWTLNLPDVPGVPIEVEVPIEGLATTLSLAPYSVRTPGFQMLEALPNGDLVPIDPGPERTMRGEVKQVPGSVVAGSVLENGLLATIKMPDGSQYWIQPIADHIQGAQPGQHIIYKSEDLTEGFGICGTDALPQPPAPPEMGGGGGAGGPCLQPLHAEIALDLDSAWVEKAGSISNAGLLAAAVIAVVNLQFEADVGISHRISSIVVRSTAESDPYTTSNPFDLFDQFIFEWETNLTGIQRDIAHLLTGRSLGGVIGLGFLPGVCIPGVGYSMAQQFGSFACQTDLTAHELGHNWGASHCFCADPGPPPENFTMNPVITCANRFNPVNTIPSIESFRDFISFGCLDCDPPPPDLGCGAPGSGDCTMAQITPYCNDTVCCGTVCAVDPFCCDVQWDADCAALADTLCTGCGESDAGRCLTANSTPGCQEPECCAAVTLVDPLCVGLWDEGCAIRSRFQTGCVFTGLDPTPDLTAFQAYRTAEATRNFEMISGLPGGGHVGPNFVGAPSKGEGFDLNGLFALGEDLLAVGVGTENLTRGKTIKVATIEEAAYVDHEDLDVILEPGQTLFLNEQITEPSHGTAALGVMLAKDNGFGMTGIAADADGYFFPSFSLEEGGRLVSAITSALLEFDPGDVLNFSIAFEAGPASLDCAAGTQYITSSAAIYTLIRMGSDLGITSCIAAGDICCDLDSTSEAGADSGAIIVAAVEPGLPYCRWYRSNHSSDPDSPIPHLSAWGHSVATLGGIGDLYGPANDPNRLYTMSFNGTGAASAMIAGAVACLQGLAKQFYGITLMPEQLRDNFAGFPQCLLPIGSDDLLGSADPPDGGGACEGDIWPQDPVDEDDPTGIPNYVPFFPEIMGWAEIVLTTDWFDGSPLIESMRILRGNLVFGTVFSIKSSDDNYLVIAGVPTVPTSPPQVPSESGVNPSYGFGLVTDVEVTARADVAFTDSIEVAVESHTTQDQALMFVELFDWKSRRWTFIGFSLPVVVDTTVVATVLGDPTSFIRKVDKKILIRVWTIALGNSFAGFGGGRRVRHIMHHDLIDLTVGQDFGIDPPTF